MSSLATSGPCWDFMGFPYSHDRFINAQTEFLAGLFLHPIHLAILQPPTFGTFQLVWIMGDSKYSKPYFQFQILQPAGISVCVCVIPRNTLYIYIYMSCVYVCYVMLCCVMLCYVMLWFAMLCNVMLCNVMQCDVMYLFIYSPVSGGPLLTPRDGDGPCMYM